MQRKIIERGKQYSSTLFWHIINKLTCTEWHGHVIKDELDWIRKTWIGLITHGLIKHGVIKRELIKHGLIKQGVIKHG